MSNPDRVDNCQWTLMNNTFLSIEARGFHPTFKFCNTEQQNNTFPLKPYKKNFYWKKGVKQSDDPHGSKC